MQVISAPCRKLRHGRPRRALVVVDEFIVPGFAAVVAGEDASNQVNPHVIVTKATKAGRGPASVAYFSHVLDDCGFGSRMIRCTRLTDLVNAMDPKLVAAAFGMTPAATMIYLVDCIDPTRLPSSTCSAD
jgi:hypothetical protein